MMQLVLLFSSLLSPLIVVNAFIVAPSFVQHHHHHQKQHPPHLMTKGRHQYRHQPLQVATTATTTATTLPDGLVKTISTPGTGPLVRRGDVASVKYTCSVLDTNNNTTSTSPPFAKSTFQKVIVADSNMIDGWEMAICTMKVGERALITIPSTLAYGEMGVAPFISPHATILLDLEILDSNPPVQLDFDALGYAEPNTPVRFFVFVFCQCTNDRYSLSHTHTLSLTHTHSLSHTHAYTLPPMTKIMYFIFL